jgi:polyisoprenyl-phosphate glycosyltransferase
MLSVVIPMYNEEEVLPLLVRRLRPALDGLDVGYEVLCVDDGSTDATAAQLAALRPTWPQVRIVRFRRNYGHQPALTAGLHRARGQYVVSIDADLQDPPEKIPQMLALARQQNLDIVYGVRTDRSSDAALKRWTAGLYYWGMRRLAGTRMPPHGGDFRLLSRATVDALRELPEHQPVYRLLVPWTGFPSGEVSYVRAERAAGRTKYPLGRMARLAADSITGFSAAPLRLATWLGLTSFVLCLLLMIYVVTSFAVGRTVPGWPSLLACVLFLGGVQLLCLGLLGEYVGRLYAAVQGRPAYYVASDTAEPGATAATASESTPARSGPAGAVATAGLDPEQVGAGRTGQG